MSETTDITVRLRHATHPASANAPLVMEAVDEIARLRRLLEEHGAVYEDEIARLRAALKKIAGLLDQHEPIVSDALDVAHGALQ